MSLLAKFDVLGVPAPQGDKSAVLIAGKPRLIEGRRGVGRERHKTWRTVVADAAKNAADDILDAGVDSELVPPFDGPLGLSVEFRFPMPASRPKRVRLAGTAYKTTAPDVDKLLRALGDSLTTAGLIRDDARFVAVEARKIETTGWTGASVTITREDLP